MCIRDRKSTDAPISFHSNLVDSKIIFRNNSFKEHGEIIHLDQNNHEEQENLTSRGIDGTFYSQFQNKKMNVINSDIYNESGIQFKSEKRNIRANDFNPSEIFIRNDTKLNSFKDNIFQNKKIVNSISMKEPNSLDLISKNTFKTQTKSNQNDFDEQIKNMKNNQNKTSIILNQNQKIKSEISYLSGIKKSEFSHNIQNPNSIINLNRKKRNNLTNETKYNSLVQENGELYDLKKQKIINEKIPKIVK